MRACAFRWFGGAIGLLLLGIPLSGQVRMDSPSPGDGETHLGYPQDWSSQHLLMPGARVEDALAARDPRHVYNMVMRQVAIENARRALLPIPRRTKVDWSVSLENGYVPQNKFPAKYRFDINSESCSSDYVVFGLTVTTGTQANLVGVNNLYTEATPPCNSGTPWVSFAYNTVTHGGQIRTSTVLSTDGTKVAFVESTAGASYFHVLLLPNPIPVPPTHAGTVLSPQTPTSCTTPTTPGCMTTLTIETAASNTNSSPWVDYASDTAYVGADNGLLYKITPVFRGGAPALVTNSDWPVTVSNQPVKVLTDPVVDTTTGRVFLGDGEGFLYAVSLSSPGATFSARQTIGWATHGAGTGIIDAPIVVNDSANPTTNQVFAFTGCSNVVGDGGAISQIAANFTNTTTYTTVDLGSSDGTGNCTGGNLHSGTFDNAFWLNGTTSGHMIGCGFVSGTTTRPLKPSNPKMYFFKFASGLITSTGVSSFVVNSTVGDECSPLTEFYNGTTDKMFFGVGGSTDGAVESSTINTGSLTAPSCLTTPSASCVKAPAALGGTSGIVIDNQVSNGGTNIYFTPLAVGTVNSQKCNVSGGSSNPYCAVKLTQSGLN
ncbi:MAG: hypothetical protein LAO30_10725 [Acidobacteriia bacterium]|nr:hypothetical protein [Terriglobia bacterium]